MKEQFVFENSATRFIGFLGRLINFLEDVVDDAYCRTVYVPRMRLYDYIVPEEVVVEPVDCMYDPIDSINIFKEHWMIDRVVVGHGSIDYRELYNFIHIAYSHTLHYKMKEYSIKSRSMGGEYFLAVLFDGRAFIVEGEKDHVTLPSIPHCLSAHTHPSPTPYPSKRDIETIINMMVNRGLMHVIETTGYSLYVYRVKPLSEEDVITLRLIEGEKDYRRIIDLFKNIKSLRIVMQ